MIELCLEQIQSRSRYDSIQPHHCQREKGHTGQHDEYPFLRDLMNSHASVANKIKRDATMTTGAAWKSDDAGPNRILRWMMLLSDDELLNFGIRMKDLKPQVVAKLREKAATYTICMLVAKKLTWLVYQMPDAPEPSKYVSEYLEQVFGPMIPNSTCCLICRLPISFTFFAYAARGKAHIETSHSNPRLHDPDNVGFAHRECNIAQGSKTLTEFYAWIEGILTRVKSDQSS
jgi:hypothetical protein